MVDNRYALVRALGSGGMAKVYLAHDEVLGRDVALKMLRGAYAEDEEFVERFKREAQSAASLSHPNIVAVHDRGRTGDGSYYIAMEYVPGGTLKDRIVRDGALAPGVSAGVAEQIADALSAAHEHGVIHRDIKPQNALVTRSGDVKVTDFGIARAAASPSVTATSVVLGTAAYMSPEQAQGRVVGPQTDLYSLGVVLYEMLTGALPFEAENPIALSLKHVNEPAPSPREANPEVPEALDEITLKLLAKEPADRYPSASALADDLARLQAGLAPTVVDAEKTTLMAAPLPPLPQQNRTAKTAVVQPPSPTRVAAPTRGAPPAQKRRGGLLRLLAPLLAGVALVAGLAYALTQAGDGNSTTTTQSPQGSEPAAPAQDTPTTVQVPDLSNLTQEEAVAELRNRGLQSRIESTQSYPEGEGYVLDQTPGIEEAVEEGGTVTLYVGDGTLAPQPAVQDPGVVEEQYQAPQAAPATPPVGSETPAPNGGGGVQGGGAQNGGVAPQGPAQNGGAPGQSGQPQGQGGQQGQGGGGDDGNGGGGSDMGENIQDEVQEQLQEEFEDR